MTWFGAHAAPLSRTDGSGVMGGANVDSCGADVDSCGATWTPAGRRQAALPATSASGSRWGRGSPCTR